MSTVYTVGHSTHTMEDFVGLLRMHEITAVADVRSSPYSRYASQFNRNNLENELEGNDIRYVFLGRELGARPDDPRVYIGGRVSFARLSRSELFQSGLDRVLRGSEQYRIALLCAEKDPIDCHRTILVSAALVTKGVKVIHILSDGQLETHEDAMLRLLGILHMPQNDLFISRDQLVGEALLRQEERISYVDVNQPALHMETR